MRKIFLEEYIQDDFLSWQGGDEVFIETPTGSGKTTFVIEQLSEAALEEGKEVLLLINRKILKKQIKQMLAEEHGMSDIDDDEIERINSFEGITVLSYQELQEDLKQKSWPLRILDKKRFKYIVFDECHYILQDATFNRNIEYLVRALPEIRSAVKIFVSATMEEAGPFLLTVLHNEKEDWKQIFREEGRAMLRFQKSRFTLGQLWVYCQCPKYKIAKVQYFQRMEVLAERINQDETDEKWLIFVNSKAEAQKLRKLLLHEIAYLDADVDEENPVKQHIIKKEKFNEKILITTKVLDNGVNIKDVKLRNLVLLTTEKTEFIQMLGRKRFLEGEEGIKVFICARDAKYFSFILNMKLRTKLNFITELKKDNHFRQNRLDDEEFYAFFKGMTILEDGKIIVSKAAEEKLQLDSEFCEEMLRKLAKNRDAFICEQLSWLGTGFAFSSESYLEVSQAAEYKTAIREFLKGFVGTKLEKEEQTSFRERFAELVKCCDRKLTDRASRLPGKAVLNHFLKEEDIEFRVESVDNSRYWMIKEVKDEAENVCG